MNAQQHSVPTVYTAMFCVNFLGEIGQRFNKDHAPSVDKEEINRLQRILDELLSGI